MNLSDIMMYAVTSFVVAGVPTVIVYIVYKCGKVKIIHRSKAWNDNQT